MSTQNNSKFEEMRSRRHMLNNLAAKPASKRDSNLIGGNNQNKKAISNTKKTSKQPSTLAKNAGKVMGLEIDQFKQWTGLNSVNDPIKEMRKHTTPQYQNKGYSSGGFAFNNDRNAIGETHLTHYSGIVKKSDYNPMNVRDIDGASSKTKSYIINKIFHKKSSIDDFMQSSTLGNGMRYDHSQYGDERTFDTKRFMRVDDIHGAKPTNKNTITEKEKKLILSNDPNIEKAYQNSHYFKKQKERQGKLPFTRRVNKANQSVINNSFLSTIDPYTGEDIKSPYSNKSIEQPNERLRKNLQKSIDAEEVDDDTLQNLKAKHANSKRSHKLGLNKDFSKNES